MMNKPARNGLPILKKVFIPRTVDRWANNAQNLNAKKIISYWNYPNVVITTCFHDQPLFQETTHLRLIKLWPWRFWRLRLFLAYVRKYDLIFYPGVDVADYWGIKFTKFFFRGTKIVATFEGLVGDDAREGEYSTLARHAVFCQKIPEKILRRVDYVLNTADQVIAISPFLAKMGRFQYGDKFKVLPLGVDAGLFYSPKSTKAREKVVVASGHVAAHKRPGLFLDLARQHRDYQFRWYGGGEQLEELRAAARPLGNVQFVGDVSPKELGAALRRACLFVMPSKAEGVPKVTQEAAACGLPIVLFGYYQAPSVQDQKNGVVVWSDEEFYIAVNKLLHNPELMRKMGLESAMMQQSLAWDQQALQWIELLHTHLR